MLIDIYFNEVTEAVGAYLYSGTVQTKTFEVRIDSFSTELILTRNGEAIKAPYSYREEYGDIEGRPCGFGFQIIAPKKAEEYEIRIRFIVSNGWLSTREYLQKLTVRVTPMPHKPKPEETLEIYLDKQKYRQGEDATITIKNISNETIWFTDTAYNIVFERFEKNYKDWAFHTAPVAGAAMTPLNPGRTAQLTWKLDQQFPLGLYRVGTHGVYAEFEVIES